MRRRLERRIAGQSGHRHRRRRRHWHRAEQERRHLTHISKTFAAAGARVVVASRNQERLDGVAGEIAAQGGEALAVSTDISGIQRRRGVEGTVMVKRPTERGAPLHFAGRELELALFQNFLESADPRAGILLVTGMPGVGKSQLLHRFEANSRAAGLAALSLNTADLAIGDSQLFMQIAHAMGMDDAGARIADKAPKQSGRRWSLKALVGTSYGETTEHVREERTLNAMMTMLSRERPPRLLVAIDELQNIDEGGATRLRVLHEGEHGCPVQVIGAGLQHTLDVLRQHGISGTAAPIELGPLARPETYEAFVEGYSAGTGAQLADEVAERMAERSQDFPQHITGYLQGAVAAFEKHGDVVGDAIEEAVAHGDKIRRQYYDHRLDAVGGIPQALPLIELFEHRAEMSRTGIEAALKDKGIDGAEMVSAAIRHGLLTQRRGILSIGIPSFRSYLQDESKTYRKVLRREGAPVNHQAAQQHRNCVSMYFNDWNDGHRECPVEPNRERCT